MRLARLPTHVAAACLATHAATVPAHAQHATAHFTRVGPAGVYLEARRAPSPAISIPSAQPRGQGIVWHATDPTAIANSVCVADTANDTWVGFNLNNRRMAAFQTDGTNTPFITFPVAANPNTVAVASAEDVSLGVLLVGSANPGSLVTVRAFTTQGGDTPIWTYTFSDGDYFAADFRGVDVSADGSIVAAIGRDTAVNKSLVVILDGATGNELNRLSIDTFVAAVELSDDGTRAMLTQGATARVIETAGMTTLLQFAVSGTGGYARISRDGRTAAAGGFNYIAYKESAGVWSPVLSRSEPSNWFGAGVALSANGDTLFMPSYNYATGYLTLTYRVIDLASPGAPEIARTSTTGAGTLQDTIQGGHAAADGSKFAIASWGTADNVHPEVQVFDRDLNRIGEIDTPGSPFSIDMTRDGLYVVVGCKRVHANTFGNGADVFSYRTMSPPPPSCPCDWNSDAAVNSQDFFDFLNGFFLGSADYNGDGVTNSQDFFDFLNCFFDPPAECD